MNTPLSNEEKYNHPDIEALPDTRLCALLLKRYTAGLVPPCSVCGGLLSVQTMGCGSATIYACSEWDIDPDNPSQLRRKEGRSCSDTHYERSRWTQYRDGDLLVQELVRRFNAA